MSNVRVLLVEDANFHRVAPNAIDHIKGALESEGCNVQLIREGGQLTFRPSIFDLLAKRNLQDLLSTPSDLCIAAGPLAQKLLKRAGRSFRSWGAEAEVEPGIPIPLFDSPRSPHHPPQAIGICSNNACTQRAAQLLSEEMGLFLVDLSDHSPQADIFLSPSRPSQPHLHALDLVLCDRPDEELPAIRAALCGVAVIGPGACGEEPFDPEAIDTWRDKARQLLGEPTLRSSHARAWTTWLTKRHDPQSIAQHLLGGLPALRPKMN